MRDPWLMKPRKKSQQRRLQLIQDHRIKNRRSIRTEGTISELRSILGLGNQKSEPYTLLAIDTELVNILALGILPTLILM